MASKENGDFCRVYIFPGGELTTFNLEPKSVEEVHNYINRIVAGFIHARELLREVTLDNANLIAQLKHRGAIIEKLKIAVKRGNSMHDSELNHLICEANGV